MIIGCFALVEPFRNMQRQFHAIKEMGIEHADLTDNHNGGMLGVEYGFAASVSLDSHPNTIRSMAKEAEIQLTSFCAHANLLDPPAPDVYGTNEIIKAIRLAHDLKIKHVITTEGDPKTDFGHSLSPEEQIFAIREKLYTPILWAEELGVELLLETHGAVTDNVDRMEQLLEALGHEKTVGVCLDTGNSWLGGSEPVEFVYRFDTRIKHVHWKDMGQEWIDKRGTLYGCGMATIPLGTGVINLQEVLDELKKIGYNHPSTLEIAGAENIKPSLQQLHDWGA